MTSTISIFGVVFLLMFVGVFFTVISGIWRMRGMANKAFTLAEREMERKLREGQSKPATATTANPDPGVCSHCGSRLTANAIECRNCGAAVP